MFNRAPDARDFDEALRRAVAIAAAAPSSHNCQPWGLARLRTPSAIAAARRTFEIDPVPGEHLLVVALDHDRALGTLVAHRTEMHLSCGIYLEALVGALAALGWPCRTAWPARDPAPGVTLDAAGWPSTWRPLLALRVRRGAAEPAGEARLVRRLSRRITNRGPYQARAIAPDALAALTQGRARVITDAAAIAGAAELVADRAVLDFTYAPAWRETHAYLRWPGDAAEDGLPVTHLFGPMSRPRAALLRARLWPPAIAGMAGAGFAARLARGLGELVAAAPALVAFSLPARDRTTRTAVALGAEILDFWLRATDHGLVLHPISVMVQHTEPAYRLAEALSVDAPLAFFARLGYPTTTFPRSPRRRDAAVAEL